MAVNVHMMDVRQKAGGQHQPSNRFPKENIVRFQLVTRDWAVR
jgi:hypothetical protein